MNGVSYGPFRANERGEPFPDDSRLRDDFLAIHAMGFNTVRLYDLPSEAVLGAALEHDLKLIVGIPWTDHVDFLRDAEASNRIKATVREAAQRLGKHESIVAILVGNEIEKTLVRWMGPARVLRFVEDLIDVARAVAPQRLISYATYPSTEYLLPDNADFVAVNVYLEARVALDKYLLRLQNLAGHKPLVITEFGLDTQAHGEAAQAEVLGWQRESALRHGVSGNVWFSFTDEWFRGGADVTDWSFGLVLQDRRMKAAALVAAKLPLRSEVSDGPRISVVVCTHNGGRTLSACLDALRLQRYANGEVIVVDDGSSDDLSAIVLSFPLVRYERQSHAGLSVARNRGMELATGEIIAYTDDDCEPDADWLMQLALAFDDPRWVAAGGPNLPPAPRTRTEAMVALAPGAPAHVLISDEVAEHLPGCNLAIRKSALQGIGGFDARFMTAGDDVDVCWRLREAGGALRFVPGAIVWHHRRFTVQAYLRQQAGYGHAEALLMQVHPQRFGVLGGARWRGLIYGTDDRALSPDEGAIFHGPCGTGLFQVIYSTGAPFGWWDALSGVLWVALALLSLVLWWPMVALAWCVLAGIMAARRLRPTAQLGLRDRALLWWLTLIQPVVRETARALGMARLGSRPSWRPLRPVISPPRMPRKRSRTVADFAFWSEVGMDRTVLLHTLQSMLIEQGIAFRNDDGWRWFDVELWPDDRCTLALRSVTEYHGGLRMLTRVALEARCPWWWPFTPSSTELKGLVIEAARRAGFELSR
jgi:hypothetical protein